MAWVIEVHFSDGSEASLFDVLVAVDVCSECPEFETAVAGELRLTEDFDASDLFVCVIEYISAGRKVFTAGQGLLSALSEVVFAS